VITPTLLGRLHHDVTHRGVTAWIVSALLIGFYILLYFTEELVPVAQAMGLDGKWTLYGLLYTVAMVGGGAWVIFKYRHNRYQVIRTLVVVGVQVSFGFSIPLLLKFLQQPEFYFSYFWPLKIEYFYPDQILKFPTPFIIWTVLFGVLLSPLLGVFLGKRWYCSWVCGCGGLANTFGEPWRHLSDKSSTSWRIEKVTIHTVLIIALLSTALAVLSAVLPQSAEVQRLSSSFRTYYGLVVGMVLSGVVGTGLYPIGGTRVWCRFFCPMAALQGLVQKVGRYRIKVKEDMCISCGLCSTYCEMGIDVRSYAQANQSFTRASCVGCGLCAEVCPRGVLRLENVRAASARLPILQ